MNQNLHISEKHADSPVPLPEKRTLSSRNLGLLASLLLPAASVLSQDGNQVPDRSETSSALKQPADAGLEQTRVPGEKLLITQEFFQDPAVKEFVAKVKDRLTQQSDKGIQTDVELEKLWNDPVKKFLTPQQTEALSELPLQERLSCSIDYILFNALRESPCSDIPFFDGADKKLASQQVQNLYASTLTRAASALGDPSIIPAKALAIISHGDYSPIQATTTLQILRALKKNQKGSISSDAGAVLYEIGLKIPDNVLAREALSLVGGGADLTAELIRIRDQTSAMRAAVKNNPDPFIALVLAETELMKHSYEKQIGALTQQLAAQEKELWDLKADAAWKEYYEKEVVKPKEDFNKRMEDPNCVVEVAADGIKSGNRKVDLIPVGARISGMRVFYQAPGSITGVQLLYDLNGKTGETPLRGTQNNGESTTFLLNADEYFTSSTIGIRFKKAPLAYLKVRSEKVGGTKKDIKDHAINTEHEVFPVPGKADSGKSDCELAVSGIPKVGIGIVTYTNGSLQAFSLVLQDEGFLNEFAMDEKTFKEDWMRREAPEHLKPELQKRKKKKK